jgi:hypothetical protein
MSTKSGKKSDNPIFKQVIDLIPVGVLKRSIAKYNSDKHCSKYFTCDQLSSMLFGQLNKCLTLKEISIGIDRTPEFLANIGLSQRPAKSTISEGNAERDCTCITNCANTVKIIFANGMHARSSKK